MGYDENDTDFDTAGETGGAKTHQLTEAELPAHTHDSIYTFGRSFGSANSGGNEHFQGTDSNSSTHGSNTFTSEATGSNTAHNNLQPYIVVKILAQNSLIN